MHLLMTHIDLTDQASVFYCENQIQFYGVTNNSKSKQN